MTTYNPNIIGVPLHNASTLATGDRPKGEFKVFTLPLNILAMIVSHLDDVADLARVARTCRVLNYMTMPQLYNSITLKSYDGIRYRDNHQVEGLGSASPFAMGLNALVTRNTVHLVKTLTLQGEWKEYDLAEYSRVGRVPDNAMILGITIRAALDRCVNLESFTWDLNTKLLPTVYGGLSNLSNLQFLRIQFPSTRTPRPTCLIPAMPRLRTICITDIDPLCYPDDMSLLLFSATNLDHLTLHFSPRMREQNEPSVYMEAYFKKFIAAKKPFKLRSVSFYNMFAKAPEAVDEWFDPGSLKCISDIRSTPTSTDSGLVFFDESWKKPPPSFKPTTLRTDFLNLRLAELMEMTRGMERIYLVNQSFAELVSSPCTYSKTTPVSNGSSQSPSDISSGRKSTPSPKDPNITLRDAYINPLISNHGQTLVHLSLPSRWPIPLSMFARLVRAAPNLTQLSIAVNAEGFQALRLFVPFLSKLQVIRLLVPTDQEVRLFGCGDGLTLKAMVEQDDSIHIRVMSRELVDEAGNDTFPNMRYVILGWKVFEIGPTREVDLPIEEAEAPRCGSEENDEEPNKMANGDSKTADQGKGDSEEQQHHVPMAKAKSKIVRRVSWDAVKDIEIIKFDTQEVVI